jgi:hypothetical protein
MSQPLQRVFVANGEMEGQQVKAFLEALGIATVVRGEALRNTHGLTLDGLGRVEILVDEADVDRARSLLAAADAGQFRLSEEIDAQDSEPLGND